jgi:hypothetical protein
LAKRGFGQYPAGLLAKLTADASRYMAMFYV